AIRGAGIGSLGANCPGKGPSEVNGEAVRAFFVTGQPDHPSALWDRAREVREGLKDRRFGRFESGPPPNPLSCACTSAARVAATRHKVRCEQRFDSARILLREMWNDPEGRWMSGRRPHDDR